MNEGKRKDLSVAVAKVSRAHTVFDRMHVNNSYYIWQHMRSDYFRLQYKKKMLFCPKTFNFLRTIVR